MTRLELIWEGFAIAVVLVAVMAAGIAMGWMICSFLHSFIKFW